MNDKQIHYRGLDVLIITYAVIFLLLAAGITARLHFDWVEEIKHTQAELEQRMQSIKSSINIELQSYQREAGLYVKLHQDILSQTADFGSTDHHSALKGSIKEWFPYAIGFAVANEYGDPVITDEDGGVGKSCLRDLKKSVEQQAQIVPTHQINGVPHIDIVVPFKNEESSGALLLTISVSAMISLGQVVDTRYAITIKPIENEDNNSLMVGNTMIEVEGYLQDDYVNISKQNMLRQIVIYLGLFGLVISYGGYLLVVLRNKIRFKAKRLYELTKIDVLTGLPNRAELDEHFIESIACAISHKDSFTLAMIDLDYFKKINDELGHEIGDLCLKAFANILKNKVITEKDGIVRLGGEEFLIYWCGIDIKQALKIVKDIQLELKNAEVKHANGSDLTCSVGLLSVSYASNFSSNELLKITDDLMYQAKNNGRNRVESKKI